MRCRLVSSPLLALALLVGASSSGGCERGMASGDTALVRDSAGVTIVESAEPAWGEGEAWYLAAEPRVSIGVAEGPDEYQLLGAHHALRLDDGMIVVGNTGRIARAPGEREPVTRAEIDAFVERMTSRGGAFAETRARLYDELPFPQAKPAYRDLIADREGNLWVMGQGLDRTVFDARGILLGAVRIPRGLSIREIGRDYVLATTRDELGVERLEVFELVKPTA